MRTGRFLGLIGALCVACGGGEDVGSEVAIDLEGAIEEPSGAGANAAVVWSFEPPYLFGKPRVDGGRYRLTLDEALSSVALHPGGYNYGSVVLHDGAAIPEGSYTGDAFDKESDA